MNAQTKISKPLVYEKIAAVQGALARHGIGKDRRNDQQNYAFRGIDDVYNALAPLLAEPQLCVLPRMLTREVTERRSVKTYNGQSKETVLFYVIVEAEFDFVAAEDGSIHTVRTFGEAMDSGDKATNKAMSAAYKYAAFMAFAIPTEGDNDADATSHTVVSDAGANQGRSLESAVSPDGPALIDDVQWSQLAQLMKASGADAKKFLAHYAITDLRDLPATSFSKARDQLNTKLAKKVKEETNKQGFGEVLADEIPY